MADVIAVVDQNVARRNLIGRVFARCDVELCLVSSTDQLLQLVTHESPHAVILGTDASDELVRTARVTRALRRSSSELPIIALVTPAQLQALHPALGIEDGVTLLNGQADPAEWIPDLLQALATPPHV